jgi:pimeloyl-ACP methyl ester carboxylesterase
LIKPLQTLIAVCIERRLISLEAFARAALIGAALAILAACASTGKVPLPQPMPEPVFVPPPPKPAPPPPQPPASLVKPAPVTLESVSLWADEYLYAGWTIQRHFYSGQHRLVDARRQLRAQGTYTACKAALDYLKTRETIQPQSRRLVLMLHGLGSTPAIMARMGAILEKDGWEAVAITYPSTEQGITSSADSVERLLRNLDGYESVSIVAHSLGGLVTRSALSRPSFKALRVPVRTVVMLGTPNKGASLAGLLGPITRAVATSAGVDLLPERAKFIGPVPKAVRFGVIAGGRGNGIGYNPLIEGDDDSVVGVSEARAENMDDFLVLPVLHGGMTEEPSAIAHVRLFLLTGSFKSRPLS